MANITPTVNVTPEEQKKYVTDPELLKELNSVGTPKSGATGYVTDPELLNQLNAPAQPKIQQQSLIAPEMLQGKAEAPGNTSLADFLVHPIDTLTGKDKVSDQSLSDLVTGQEPAGGNHPFLASTAKGIMNFKSMVNDQFISEILPLIEDHKRQYGLNYEKATPEQRKDFLNSEAELATHLNKQAQYNKDVEAVTKKYGTDDFSKKADGLYSKPEFQNANTLKQFQMYGDLVLSHPKDIPGHIATVSLESLPTSLTSIVAATMAKFMGTGPTGAMMAGGAASGVTEFASEYVDLRQQGKSHEEATMQAGVKSTLIGNMDARSFASAGEALDKVMGQVDKGIVKRVLSTAKETAKELNKQGMYGAAGEVLGSIASGQKVDPRAALDEYFGELATGPLEALTTYRGKLAEEKAAGAEPALPGTPPPGGGAPPPTAGAISDTEFDVTDIPGTPPTTPPPSPATPTAEPEIQEPVIKSKKQADAEEAAARALQEEERIKATKEVMKRTYGAKPIEDKEVEKEAYEILAGLEKYKSPIAAGARNAIEFGHVQTSQQLDFFRRKLAEEKAKAEEAPTKETATEEKQLTQAEINKARQEEKKAAAEKAKQPIDTSSIQNLVGGLRNHEGFKIYKVQLGSKEFEWRTQSLENKTANRVGNGDSFHSTLELAKDQATENFNSEANKKISINQPAKQTKTEAKPEITIDDYVTFKEPVIQYKGNEPFTAEKTIRGRVVSIKPNGDLELKSIEGYYTKPLSEVTAEQKEVTPQAEEKPAVRYDPSTDKYTGNIKLGDTVSDGKDNFIVTRRSGYLLEVDKVTPEGRKVYGSINVDPTSTEFKGNLYKVAEAPKIEEKKPEVKEPTKLAQKEAEPEVALPPKGLPKDIQARLERLHRLATLAEKKVMDKPLTMDDVVNAYNRVEDSKKEENLANTEKNMARQAENKLLIKIEKEYVTQFESMPPKKQGLIAAIKNGSLDISKQEWAKDAYDLFKIKQVKVAPKLEGVSDPVAEQLNKFNAGDYRMPEKIKGTVDDAQSKKDAEEQNEKNFKVYEEAAKLFLEGPLDAKPEKILETEGFKDNSIQPQPIEKKSADKAIANAEEQNKVISEIIDKKDVRYYLGGILIDRENDRMVTCDGHRATILKKPDYSSVPNPPEKTTGDLILKDDGTWIDGKYPAIDRIIPESHADNKITVNAKDIADYARGIEKANKFLKSDEVFSIFLQNPDAVGTFNAKFIRQMGDLFRRFGYKDIILSLDEGKKLFATSSDGKLSHIVMGIRSKNEIFKTFSKIFKVEKAKGARGDGQTIESIKDRIVREFGRSVQQLFKDGLIVVVNTVAELDPKYQNELDANDKAFFDKETGVAYIIADRVSAGDVRAVVLHEVGEHYGLRGMLGEKVYNEQLNNLKKQKDRDIIVAKAWEHVTKNYANLLETDEKQFLREVMARIGENAPTHNLFQRIKTAIKAFLVKKGIIKNLTGAELQDLVMRSLHTVVKGRRVLSSGTGLESARGPSDPDAKRELDDEFRANEVPDAPFNNQKDIADKLTENIKEAKVAMRGVVAAPKQSGIAMISGLDQALTSFRIKNVFFGAGLEESEARQYVGKLVDSNNKALASVALTNAIHAGHIAANVMHLGKLTFNQATQMFQAAASHLKMDNVFKLERKLFKKLGKQTATNLINTFFEAKRARSIQNEFLDREALLQEDLDEGLDPEVAQRNYESILKAYKKIPEYFQQRDAQGDLVFTDLLDDNGDLIDQIPVLDDAKIDNYINKDQEFPELKEMMDNWTGVNHNMLDNMVFAGIISKKRGDHLKSIKDYVPWFRVQDGAEELHAPSTFVAGLTNISKERVFRKGAVAARIDNMIDNMVFNVMMMTRNSIRNYAALQIAQRYATRKPNGKIQVFPKEGVMPDGAIRTNILVNGRRIIIEIKNPHIAAALMGMENLELPILDVLSSFSQGLRRGVTTNPFFQWWQVWKDAPTAAAVTGLKSPLKVWGKILGSFFMALNPNDPIVQTLKSYGIGGFQSSARTAEKEVDLTRGQALMNIGPWILKVLDHIGDASDYAQRRIIYQEVLKQGGTEMEAVFRSNAVIDFLRHGNGKASLGLVRTVTFMNAYIQQIDVLATSMAGGGFKGMSREKARQRFRRVTYTLVATGLIYCMMKGGDDDYDKLDDQTKMRNFIIGDMKIPINTSYGFMFKALPEMIYNYIIKHGTDNAIDETRLRKALSRAAFDSLLGPNPIPTGVRAPVEIILNHDFFTGGTVTPKGMESLDTYMQYTSSTSNLGKLMSHLTLGTLNPIESDHLMRGLFGTVGSTAGWLSDMFTSDKPERIWARNPVIGQVFLPPEPRGREDLFYELKQRSDKSYNTWETLNKRGRADEAEKYFDKNKSTIMVHDYITNAEAGLKEINAEIRRLSDDPRLTPAEKRDQITIFQQQKNDILESVNQERLRAERSE